MIEKNFDKKQYDYEWQKKNMKQIQVKFNIEFVEEFKQACKKMNISQRSVFEKAMQKTIKKANQIR